MADVRRRAQVGEPLRDPVDELVRVVRLPPGQIDEVDRVLGRERGCDLAPPARRAGQAVHEHDR